MGACPSNKAQGLGLPTCCSRDHSLTPPLTLLIYHLSLQDYQKYTDQPCTLIGFMCVWEKERECVSCVFYVLLVGWMVAKSERMCFRMVLSKAAGTFVPGCVPILASQNLWRAQRAHRDRTHTVTENTLSWNKPEWSFEWVRRRFPPKKQRLRNFCTVTVLNFILFKNEI